MEGAHPGCYVLKRYTELKKLTPDCDYRGVDVLESVVEVPKEEGVMEPVGDVKHTEVLGAQVQALDDVNKVLVPPANKRARHS